MAQLFFAPVLQVSDANGAPYSGALAYFYLTGTTTAITVYQDSTLATPHANPVVADTSGQFAPIYLASNTAYKVVIKTSGGVTIRTIDPIINYASLTDSQLLTSKLVQGRLTLTSGTAVTTSDVTASANIYFTPFGGNQIVLYTSSQWTNYTFTEITQPLGTLVSGKNYDVFAYDSSGAVTLEMVVWTDDTTRATALTLQDGVYVKTGSTNKRYLGTFRTTATTTTEDSKAKRFVWNMYNRRSRPLRGATETANTWTYQTATLRQANANTANQLDFVRGLDEDVTEAFVQVSAFNSSTDLYSVGIGLDSTTTLAADQFNIVAGPNSAGVAPRLPVFASYRGLPGVGRHTLVWLEYSTNAGTTTWQGDNNQPTVQQSGIHGFMQA